MGLGRGRQLRFGLAGTNASRYYLNPMLGLYAAVTRKTLSGQPEGGWFPQEKLTVEEAIQAYTLNTAYAGFEEDMKGSLTVGKLTDFVVLSDNLLTMNPDEIKDVTVETTVVGGKSRLLRGLRRISQRAKDHSRSRAT